MLGELQPGDPGQVGPYRLTGVLGSGGMGRVYLGWSTGGRPVAVKLIKAELASDSEFRLRFRREVEAARSISGLYTAMLVDADLDGPTPWLATVYIDGPSLAETVATYGSLPPRSVQALAAGLAEALASIHTAGLVHRDMKPSNVLLAADGPRVIDFGLSRAADSTALTHTGQSMGSPGFLSPEQARGEDTGPASDVFSLGGVLAFAASGNGPFGMGTLPALVYRVVHEPPSLVGVPEELRPLILRCLEKDPADRPTAHDLLAELGGVQPGGQWLPERITAGLADFAASAAPRTTIDRAAPAVGAVPDTSTGTVHPVRGVLEPASSPTSSVRSSRPRRRLAVAGAAAIVVAAAVGAFALTSAGSSGAPSPTVTGNAGGSFSPIAVTASASSSVSRTPKPAPSKTPVKTRTPAPIRSTATVVVTAPPVTQQAYSPPPPVSTPTPTPKPTVKPTTPKPSPTQTVPNHVNWAGGIVQYNCPGNGLRSGTNTTPATLRVVNETAFQLQLWWVTTTGAREVWADIAPYGSLSQSTDIDQAWVVADGNSCGDFFMLTGTSAQVTVS